MQFRYNKNLTRQNNESAWGPDFAGTLRHLTECGDALGRSSFESKRGKGTQPTRSGLTRRSVGLYSTPSQTFNSKYLPHSTSL